MEGVDVIMLVMNDQGFQHMLSSKFELSGDASAAAGPVGRHASAGTDWKMNTEVLTYSRARGLFAGITLNGAVLEPDDDSTRAIYGREVSFRSIPSGDIQAPKSTLDFMKAIADAGHAGTFPKWARNRSENALNSTDQGPISFNNSKGRTRYATHAISRRKMTDKSVIGIELQPSH